MLWWKYLQIKNLLSPVIVNIYARFKFAPFDYKYFSEKLDKGMLSTINQAFLYLDIYKVWPVRGQNFFFLSLWLEQYEYIKSAVHD